MPKIMSEFEAEDLKLTPEMARRYEAGKFRFKDPCVVCGGDWETCGHEEATPVVIKRLKKLGKAGRAKL